jgi:pSer/pThr/pTyr-binding forkhead associated (FHA) protein
MAGKEFILYHAVTRLGSSPDCEIFLLKDPSVEKLHAEIQDDGTRRVLTAAPGTEVLVNEAQVVRQVLRHGDCLRLGGTVIGYSERAPARMGTA